MLDPMNRQPQQSQRNAVSSSLIALFACRSDTQVSVIHKPAHNPLRVRPARGQGSPRPLFSDVLPGRHSRTVASLLTVRGTFASLQVSAAFPSRETNKGVARCPHVHNGYTVAGMTALQHVYLTAHGTWNSGPWAGEGAQFGLRLCTADTASAPALGTIWTPEINGDAVVDSGTQAGTNGTLTKTWTARRGLPGSTENWDAGLQIDMAEDMRTFLVAITAYHATFFRWTHVKVSPVSAAGKAIQSSSVYTFTTPIAGTGAGTLPPQIAMALSLRADIIGRRGRGRIYLPALVPAVNDTTGVVPTATQATFRTAFKTLVDNLQNLPGTPQYIPIVSILSPGQATVVRPSQIRTGNRLDTIQSRRRQVAEVYATTAL